MCLRSITPFLELNRSNVISPVDYLRFYCVFGANGGSCTHTVLGLNEATPQAIGLRWHFVRARLVRYFCASFAFLLPISITRPTDFAQLLSKFSLFIVPRLGFTNGRAIRYCPGCLVSPRHADYYLPLARLKVK